MALANGLPVLVDEARALCDRMKADIAVVLVGGGPAKAECAYLARAWRAA